MRCQRPDRFLCCPVKTGHRARSRISVICLKTHLDVSRSFTRSQRQKCDVHQSNRCTETLDWNTSVSGSPLRASHWWTLTKSDFLKGSVLELPQITFVVFISPLWLLSSRKKQSKNLWHKINLLEKILDIVTEKYYRTFVVFAVLTTIIQQAYVQLSKLFIITYSKAHLNPDVL